MIFNAYETQSEGVWLEHGLGGEEGLGIIRVGSFEGFLEVVVSVAILIALRRNERRGRFFCLCSDVAWVVCFKVLQSVGKSLGKDRLAICLGTDQVGGFADVIGEVGGFPKLVG